MRDKNLFLELAPSAYYLDMNDSDGLESYLKDQGVFSQDEIVKSLSKPGEGNMNLVLRVTTNERTFIVKQSRPWVEKYPQIKAPIYRVNVEAEFIRICNSNKNLKNLTPRIIRHFPDSMMLVMEDLGETSDYSHLYHDGNLSLSELDIMSDYLYHLHGAEVLKFSDNAEMKKLNHEHIFVLPFQADNGLDLNGIQSGLQSLSDEITGNQELCKKVNELGDKYLAEGHVLVHGDFYLGSILDTSNGLKVIDAEFSFLGFAEFDWAVLYAHLMLSTQADHLTSHLLTKASKNDLDISIVKAYAGVEILRRLLGVAQLPLSFSLVEKRAVIKKAIDMIMA